MPSSQPLFVIIDGNAIVHRAFHALPPMTTKNGTVVNAVYGFTSMLLKVWRELKPAYLAVTFDVAGGTFRDELFTDYKGTRTKADQSLYDQIPLVHEVVEAFGLKIFEKKGFEADDVIGTITAVTTKASIPTLIVTGDMDTLQLVDNHVKVYTLRKGITDVVVYDAAGVTERFGFGPEHVIDYKALRGDVSDNIPGVPGIGEKTATELIKKYGTIDDLYHAVEKKNAADEFKPSVLKKLIEGKDKALMSRELATIRRDVPDLSFTLEDCRIRPFERERIMELFQKFEFVSLLKRLPELGSAGASSEENKSKKTSKTSLKPTFLFHEVATEKDLEQVKKKIRAEKKYVARIITSGENLFATTITHLVVIIKDEAYSINGNLITGFSDIFADASLEFIGHDLKTSIKHLSVHGIKVANNLSDIMIASYLLNPGTRTTDLSSIALKTLGKELVAPEGQGSLFGVDTRVVAEELWYVHKIAEALAKELAAIDDYGLFKKMEMPLIAVLASMELNGITLDTEKIKAIAAEVEADIKKTTATVYELTGTEFNIASPIQLRDVLFDKLAIPVEGVKKGKTGLSTSAESLEKLRDLHPVIPYIEQFRELTKLQNTYIDVLPTLINPITHRIHTTFNQAVAATGRLSSTDPNLQNIPVRTRLGREIRTAFTAAPGNILVSADYSQIELRVVASLASDEKMMEIFKRGDDIHRATAAAIHGVAQEDVTKEMRYAAKEINFGVLYGMGTYGLSWRAGIPHWQAKEFIEKYFEEFKGVKEYLDRTLEFTRKEGYCETLFGRRRYIPELVSSNYQVRSAAERMAVNHPIQGTAADIMKLAMIEVEKKLNDLKPQTPSFSVESTFRPLSPKLLLQVHDELVVECPPDEAEGVGNLMKQTMESVVELRVPVKVEVKQGFRWGELE